VRKLRRQLSVKPKRCHNERELSGEPNYVAALCGKLQTRANVVHLKVRKIFEDLRLRHAGCQ
jgi:hypothetical protein